VQLILVDNNSEDDTVDYLEKKYRQVKIMKNEDNLGFARGNNVAIRWALKNGFNYVALLNDDTVVDENWLLELLKVIKKDEQIAAVQSKILLHSDKTKINSWGNYIHFLGFGFSGGYLEPDQKLQAKEITYASGSSVLFRASALREVGPLEEDFFMYHEDLEIGLRLKLAGFKTYLAPKSIVYHKYSFSKSIRKYYDMERNRFVTFFTYLRWPTLLLIALPLIIMELGMFIYSFITGWYKEKIKVYKYLLSRRAWYKIRKRRFELQKMRQVSDRHLTHDFVGKVEFQDISNPVLDKLVNPVFNLYWQVVKRCIFW